MEAQAGPLIPPMDWQEGWKRGGLPGRGGSQTEPHITSQKLSSRGGRQCVPGKREYIPKGTKVRGEGRPRRASPGAMAGVGVGGP